MTQLPSPAELRELALTEDEYRRAVELLGRLPNQLELGMLGAMWSEHCSYKTSKRLLRQLPTRGEAVVLGPGENAGVVDLGDSLLCCFKIESHNHPSAIEPVQGAATGVGGILRDVFAMGARPVALLDAMQPGVTPTEAMDALSHATPAAPDLGHGVLNVAAALTALHQEIAYGGN